MFSVLFLFIVRDTLLHITRTLNKMDTLKSLVASGLKRKRDMVAPERAKKKYLSRGEIERIRLEEEDNVKRLAEEKSKPEESGESAAVSEKKWDDEDDILIADLPVIEVKRRLRSSNNPIT